MTPKGKVLLIFFGFVAGLLLTLGASDMRIILKEKTQEQKDTFAFLARSASVVSIIVFVLIILKKIRMRPSWSYFVMGLSMTYSIINMLVLTIFPKLLG